MTRIKDLQPTVWRTCRALANRKRLMMLRFLAEEPDVSVTDIAGHLGLTVPVASHYLRILDARGLVEPHRMGRWVVYRLGKERTGHPSAPLTTAFHAILKKGPPIDETIYRMATAFTHPRRVSIVIALKDQPLRLRDLEASAGVPRQALCRHLRKLVSRGVVRRSGRRYELSPPPNPIAKILLRMVLDPAGQL